MSEKLQMINPRCCSGSVLSSEQASQVILSVSHPENCDEFSNDCQKNTYKGILDQIKFFLFDWNILV